MTIYKTIDALQVFPQNASFTESQVCMKCWKR